ncbi:MAG: sulfite reductase subunit alpha [Gammaproteobacteria bacterium]
MPISLIPDNAPFSPAQRAWLDGFFTGVLGLEESITPNLEPEARVEKKEDYPWHDDTMPIAQRMDLAEDRPYRLKLMAAMGQQDCGQCGYLCKSYAEAIASGAENDLTLCVPGGKETRKMLKELFAKGPNKDVVSSPRPAAAAAGRGVYSRKAPFNAKAIAIAPLTKNGSVKEARHVAIDLTGSGITYQPGDSLGVFPHNCPALVQSILETVAATGEEQVTLNGSARSVREAMSREFDITKPSDEAIEFLAEHATDSEQAAALRALAQAGADEGQDLLDILEEYPSARPRAADLVPKLGRLQPRLYSIASSLRAHKNEVHLTVGIVRYRRKKRLRKGVGSTYFADALNAGDQVGVYVQAGYSFRLPQDGEAAIIMVGPGTGIAPFRAFLEERAALGHKGKNWLFFGNPHSATDFFYEKEIEKYEREGLLTKLNTAFSRDQQDKLYVQHRMVQNSKALWAWLQEGAYFYVCGDATRMAPDVDAALHRIAVQVGQLTEEGAAQYVKKLAAEGRYLKDVY